MTKDESIEAMRQGKKVTHKFFTQDEWMERWGTKYRFENGVVLDPLRFWADRKGVDWQHDWSIFESPPNSDPAGLK